MEKTFTAVPRGIALVIGCSTFPTWNSYPGLFASLATGNAVVVKPHPAAILPLAITVSIAREVLAEAGFSPNLVTLVAENPGGTVASESGGAAGGARSSTSPGRPRSAQWLEEHARQAAVYTEKAGVNMVLVDSTDDYAGMLANLAFSLCLYSGQMCTTPQDLLVPADGVGTPEGRKSVDEFAADLGAAVEKLLGPDAQAVELLGAIVNDGVLSRVDGAGTLGTVVIPSRTLTHPAYPQARVRTPALVRVPAERVETWGAECFGPVSFLVVTDTTEDALELIRRTVTARGALTAAAYSTDEKVVESARAVAHRVRRRAVREPHRRRVRQPDRGVLRPARDGRQPGRERRVHRCALRRRPVPGDPDPPAHDLGSRPWLGFPRTVCSIGCGRCVWRCPRRPRSSATASRPGSSVGCSCRSPTGTTTTASRSGARRRRARKRLGSSADPTHYFVPPYVGGRGWLGVYLDVPVDWDEVADVITDAYRQIAPKRMLARLDD